MNMLTRWFVCVTLCVAVAGAEAVLSVCNVLKQVSTLNGKEVSVRGAWRVGLEYSMLWAPEGCDEELSGKKALRAISLEASPSDSMGQGVKVDEESLRRVGAIRREVDRAEYVGKLVVTFRGIIEAEKGIGYGHLGGFSVQMRLLSAREPEIVWTKTKNPLRGLKVAPW